MTLTLTRHNNIGPLHILTKIDYLKNRVIFARKDWKDPNNGKNMKAEYEYELRKAVEELNAAYDSLKLDINTVLKGCEEHPK